MRKTIVAACATLMVCSAAFAEKSDRQPGDRAVSGEARVAASKLRHEKDAVTVPVTLDLTGVKIDGRDAILGGYVARVTFDPAQVRFVAARGGEAKAFARDPYATNADQANRDGVVKLAGVNVEFNDAVGTLNVAQLQFVEKQPGGSASIRVAFDSVASALVKEASGEMSQHSITIEEEAQR